MGQKSHFERLLSGDSARFEYKPVVEQGEKIVEVTSDVEGDPPLERGCSFVCFGINCVAAPELARGAKH